MNTILLILGKETTPFAKGDFNQGLFNAAVDALKQRYEVLTTVVEEGYDPAEEIAKFKRADAVIYQYPVFWFSMPPSLKKYLDEVYAYGEFFAFGDGGYGSGGLMQGKKVMLSTTWNAPESAFNDPDTFFEGASLDDALISMRKTHTFCGFEELPHFASYDVIHAPDFEGDKARLQEHLKQVFL